jgi:hypothetical protein
MKSTMRAAAFICTVALSACGGGGGSPAVAPAPPVTGSPAAPVVVTPPVTVTPPTVVNSAPVVVLAPDRSVPLATVVTLDGSASTDADGDVLSYVWRLTSAPAGSTAVLGNANAAVASLVPDIVGAYGLTLTVSDGKTSIAATAVVNAVSGNVAPVAAIGVASANGAIGALASFDGALSTDANADILSYAWALTAKPVGSASALSSATAARTALTPDLAGQYVVTLVVNDGKLNSAPASVTTTVAANAVPEVQTSYALGGIGNEIYKIDETSGSSTSFPGTNCGTPISADAAVDGRIIALNALAVIQVDVSTGICRSLFATPEYMQAIAVAADGTIVTVSGNTTQGAFQAYRFSAAGSLIGQIALAPLSTQGVIEGIDFAADGSLYALSQGSVFSINAVSGAVKLVATAIDGAGDIDIDRNGLLRTINNGTLNYYSTTDWKLSKTLALERSVFYTAALVRR